MEISEVLFKALESSFTGLILCISLFVFLLVEKSFNRKVTNYFIVVIVAVFMLVLADAGSYICANFPSTTTENYPYIIMGLELCTFFTLSLRPLAIYCFACIIDKKRFKFKERIAPLLLILSSINNFVSMFSGHVFKFAINETQNAIIYSQGPCIWIASAVLISYAIYLGYILVSSYKRQDLGFTILAWISVGIAISLGVLEKATHVNFVFNSFLAIMLVMSYIYLHIDSFKRDNLTGLYTRKQMYNFFETNKKKPIEIIYLDINDLKKMNDSEGHEYGDGAIVKVANSIRDCLDRKTQVFRIGGDEFLILSLNSHEKVGDLCLKIDVKLSETDIIVAYGRSTYHPGEPFEKACARADVRMYASKTAYKNDEELHSRY